MDNDLFIKNSIYPTADKIFTTQPKPISSAKDDCIFVIDTNALLVPYHTTSQDLEYINLIFSSLIERRRLFIPGQVAREFASNRSDRIKELFQQLNRRINTIQEFPNPNHLLLNGIPEYSKMIDIEKEFNEIAKKNKKEYKVQLDRLLNRIKEWSWNDPVSELYSKLFTKDVVFDFDVTDKESIKKELHRRYTNHIPPGYKDKEKADDGIGDLLIWFTILELGRKYKKSVILVSGEEKADWVIKSEGQVLCPRYELISEFAEASSGQSFHIIKLSELFGLMEGSAKLINEIKSIENNLLFHPNFRIPVQDIREIDDPILFGIDTELELIKRTIIQFISERIPDLIGNESFLDDLTALHRGRVLPYNIYKRVINLFAIYERRDSLGIETHLKNLEEIRQLKIFIFEALAGAFLNFSRIERIDDI